MFYFFSCYKIFLPLLGEKFNNLEFDGNCQMLRQMSLHGSPVTATGQPKHLIFSAPLVTDNNPLMLLPSYLHFVAVHESPA